MIRFRRATLSDLPCLNVISVASKKHWGYPDDWIQKWIADLKITEAELANMTVTVAQTDATIIGFCAISDQPDSYEIVHLWLLPEYIGQGIGKRLLTAALAASTPANKTIVVTADPNAEAFYNNQGFVTFDKIESYPKGRFLPVMKRPA